MPAPWVGLKAKTKLVGVLLGPGGAIANDGNVHCHDVDQINLKLVLNGQSSNIQYGE